jgi:hypothetical protein
MHKAAADMFSSLRTEVLKMQMLAYGKAVEPVALSAQLAQIHRRSETVSMDAARSDL